MAKILDLRGQTFNRLYALRRVKTPKGWRWFCFCKCGGRTLATAASLRSGKVRSCGCLRREATAEAKRIKKEREDGSSVRDMHETEDRNRFNEDLNDALRDLGVLKDI